MRNQKVFALVLFVALLTIAFQIQSLAQSATQETKDTAVANLSSAGSGVRFDIRASYTVATLIVSAPDGRIFRQDSKSGSPEFALTDKHGERLPDGQYAYELRLTSPVTPAIRYRDDEPEAVRAGRKRVQTQGVVQSGGFSIVNGAAVVSGDEDGSAAKPVSQISAPTRLTGAPSAAISKIRQHHLVAVPDQVIPDDLIVQGSACVGLDCVNGEVFDFDTLRLKENNTRLQFNDTSTTAGFPTNNWQIRANDSGGGTSFLGFVDQGASGVGETGTIVFRTDAGAPANSLRVSSTGRIGLRTATPVLDVHANTGDTPAIRLEQNNTGGFTAQTWDIAGNEANFFVRDLTSGSRLPFRIRPGAPTSSIDISASGFVGIGTASPAQIIHSKVTQGDSIWRMDTNTKAAGVLKLFDASGDVALQTNTSSNVVYLKDNGNVGIGTTAPDQKFSVNGDASKSGGGSWQVFSDQRLKSVKGNFTSGLKALMQLQPIRYEYKKENALGIKSAGEHVGFVAQAVKDAIPEAVTTGEHGFLLVNNDPILWTMLNAIKEQQKEIEQLKAEVRQLRKGSRRR